MGLRCALLALAGDQALNRNTVEIGGARCAYRVWRTVDRTPRRHTIVAPCQLGEAIVHRRRLKLPSAGRLREAALHARNGIVQWIAKTLVNLIEAICSVLIDDARLAQNVSQKTW